jgi:hypothetical protein
MPRTIPALADRIVGIRKKELSHGDVQGSDDAAFGAAVPVALSVALDDMEVASYRFDELSARVRYIRILSRAIVNAKRVSGGMGKMESKMLLWNPVPTPTCQVSCCGSRHLTWCVQIDHRRGQQGEASRNGE